LKGDYGMLNKGDKLILLVSGVLAVGGLIETALAYARARYYQGRIDALNEVRKQLVEIRDEILERESKDEEEAE
jgi:hypothetical protein